MSVIAVQRRARTNCEIDILADPVCLARLDLTVVHD
jgi:hypothetical protein